MVVLSTTNKIDLNYTNWERVKKKYEKRSTREVDETSGATARYNEIE